MEAIQRDLNTLSDPDRRKRIGALERILKHVTDTAVSLDATDLMSICKTALKMMEDKSEKCREISVAIVSETTPRLEREVLHWVIPSVVARIGVEPVAETSEEIRQQLMLLARDCLEHFPDDIGNLNYIDHYKVLLENCLKDTDPEVRKLACKTIRLLCKAEPKRVKHIALPLAKVVKNMCLQFKHGAVRVLAVECFSDLIARGANDMLGDSKDEQDNRTTVYYLYILCNDHTESVRSATLELLGRVLLDTQQRMDHHRRLIPLLMFMVSDDIDSVRARAQEILHLVGKLYAMDNEDNRGDIAGRRVTLKDIEWYADEDYPDMNLVTKSTLPLPDLLRRPYLGTRHCVADCTRNFLDAVLKDIVAVDWTIPFSNLNKRVVALRTLIMTIYYNEDNIVQYAQQILEALYRILRDEDKQVRNESLVAVELLGKFMTPAHYLPLIISQPAKTDGVDATSTAEGPQVTRKGTKVVTLTSAEEGGTVPLPTLFSTAAITTRTSVLQAFRYILLGSRQSFTAEHGNMVVRALTNTELIDFDSPPLMHALIDAISVCAEILVAKGLCSTPQNPCPDLKKKTYDSMLLYTLLSLNASEDLDVRVHANKAVAAFSTLLCGTSEGIFELHCGRLLQQYVGSMPVCVMSELLLHAKNLQPYAQEITTIFHSHLHEVNYALRITDELKYASLLNNLLEAKTIRFTNDQIEILVRSVVFVHTRFHPGQPAHLFRKVAVSTLSTVLMNGYLPQEMLEADNASLADKVIQEWLHAMDSDDAEMRLSCIVAIPHVLSLPVSQANAEDIIKSIIIRLDDSAEALRKETAKKLLVALELPDFTAPTVFSYLKSSISSNGRKLLLHMDDVDVTVKRTMCEVMKLLCHLDAASVYELVRQARPKHMTAVYCDEVLAYTPPEQPAHMD